MPVLIIKNAVEEGPGTIGDFLGQRGTPFRVVEPEGIKGVDSLAGYDTLVVMGGPMAVYEGEKNPHVMDGIRLMEAALGEGKRVLGVCLGAQMLARALGARVYRGPVEELGWLDVELTPEGASDSAFGAILDGDAGRKATVFQWHGDTFDIPDGAVRLAGSEMYENQAFRHGKGAYGLQFHIEVDDAMLSKWFGWRPEGPAILAEMERIRGDYRQRAEGFYRRFFV